MRVGSIASVKTIQIRNVPDDVHAELRIRAARAGMSLSDYALAQLERTTEKPPLSEVLERAGKRPGGVSGKLIVETIRAGRDALD